MPEFIGNARNRNREDRQKGKPEGDRKESGKKNSEGPIRRKLAEAPFQPPKAFASEPGGRERQNRDTRNRDPLRYFPVVGIDQRIANRSRCLSPEPPEDECQQSRSRTDRCKTRGTSPPARSPT
jgi:hypothetical protein